MDIEMKVWTSLPFHLPSKETWTAKSLHSAPLTGSLYKHKVSVKLYFLLRKGLTRVCSVSLVCDVRPWTIRFKNVLGQREPLSVSHNRELNAQAEGRNMVSMLWKQSEQKKTSWKQDLLSAAGCCREWQKQICLAPMSGWEQTTLQPDRSIKNCCFPQHGKDVAGIDVSWYPQLELKSLGCSCKLCAMRVGSQGRGVLQLQRKLGL